MRNPPHLGELVWDSMEAVGWSVPVTAARLGCEPGPLSRVLRGEAGIPADMAVALEGLGWGTTEQGMRMQASYERAQARRASQLAGTGAGAWRGGNPVSRSGR